MPERLAVIGHPLAAEENRLAFEGWSYLRIDLIAPRLWKSRSLGHDYRLPSRSADAEAGKAGPDSALPGKPVLHALSTLASGRNSLFMWIGLERLLRRLDPDILYCWEEPWCLSAWQVGRVARRLGIPMVFYTAENRRKRLPWPFPALLRRVFSVSAGCIAPTEEIAARIRALGFTGRIFVIPLWIRPRRPLRADGSERSLAYVGRLIPLKRVDLLVESLSLLPEFRLRIIGDGPERPRLAALVRRLGLETRVDFRGHVGNRDLEPALEGSSLLILPTGENARQAEQFGKAALEAVSCGLPVLASRTGNLSALANAITTMAARDLDSPAQMASAVTDVFRNFPPAEALDGARLKAAAEYGPAAAAKRLEAAFADLLAGGKAP